jgi:hypothetical protein
MDYAAEQEMELEALRAILMDEFQGQAPHPSSVKAFSQVHNRNREFYIYSCAFSAGESRSLVSIQLSSNAVLHFLRLLRGHSHLMPIRFMSMQKSCRQTILAKCKPAVSYREVDYTTPRPRQFIYHHPSGVVQSLLARC